MDQNVTKNSAFLSANPLRSSALKKSLFQQQIQEICIEESGTAISAH